MKLSNAAKAMTIVAVFVLALTAAPAAKATDKGSSNATLKGPYSDKDTGTNQALSQIQILENTELKRSFAGSSRFCLQPRYRSVVKTEA